MAAIDKPESTDASVSPLDRTLRAGKNSLKPHGHTRQYWWHRAGTDVTQDNVRHTEYWSTIAKQLARHDIITVLAEDETWELELCVERVLPHEAGAIVSVRKAYKREGIVHAGRVVDGLGDFYSEWRPGLGWCVIRRKDGHPVVQGHTMEVTAVAEWQRAQPKRAA